MKRNFITVASLLVLLLTTFISNAQGNDKPAQSFMYSSGRIYVVIAVMLTILAGLIIYLKT